MGCNLFFFLCSIPLSSAADEEWGWEDGGSKVEMSSFSSTGMNGSSSTYSRDAARKAEEDLQLALALSVSRSQPQSRSSSVASKQSNSEVGLPPSNSRLSTNGISSANRTSVTAPSPPPEPSFPHMPKTSSKPTSAPPVVVPKKPLPRKRDDDDIFATMGLVAKPTFSAANGRTSPSTNIAKNESSGDASRNVATKSTVPAVQKRSVTPPVPMVGTQDIVLANKSQKGNATAPTANIGVGNGNKANVTDVESKEEDDLLAAEIAQELGNSNDTNASWGEDDDLDDLLND